MRTSDKDAIRTILNTDRIWAAYARGDMAPGFFEHAAWYILPEDPTALALVLRLFERPVVYLQGAPTSISRLLDEIGALPGLFFLARQEAMPALRERYRLEVDDVMKRMSLEPADFRFSSSGVAERLDASDGDALERLYSDGVETGEQPDFFTRSMLEKGVYYGVREEGDLIAAAGTHLFEPTEGMGAIGNVYTRRDRRGRCLAVQTVGSVTAELLRQGLPTLVLNVKQFNAPAQRVYERLGFRFYCLFEEGIASSPSRQQPDGKP